MKGKERENGPLWLITLRDQPPLCATPLLMTCFNALPSKMSVVPNMSQELPVHGQLRVKKTHVYRRFWFSKLKVACVFLLMVLVWSDFFGWHARCLRASGEKMECLSCFLRTSVRKTILVAFLCSCGVPGCPFGLRLDLIVFYNSNFSGPGIFQLAWRNGNERKGNKRALMEMKGKERENGPLWLITLRGQPPLCATPLLMTCFNALPSKMSVVPNMSQEKGKRMYRRFWYFLVKMACTFSFHDLFHKSQHVWSHFLW